MNLSYTMTIRIMNDEKIFGPGVSALLHRIQELKSLRAAAADMNMAYSKAWRMIKNAEKGFGTSLLDTSIGGKNGGGAVLTEEALAILNAYDAFNNEMKEIADLKFKEKFANLL